MKTFFHKVSYLQYPFMLAAACYAVLFALSARSDLNLQYVNMTFVFAGIAVSLSTLQDTTTTQNEISRKVWMDPKKGKFMLGVLALYAFAFITIGLAGFVIETESAMREISLGLVVLGIGMVGLIKSASEMFENHRRDKNPS